MRSQLLKAIALVVLVSMPAPAMAQARAPKGGMYVNGRFYKGGQFIPNGAGSAFGTYGGGIGVDAPPYVTDVPDYRKKARKTARTSARTDYRTSSRAPDPDAIAKSRVLMARNLVELGKDADAKGWLDKVLAEKASPKVTDEARVLLAEIDARARPRRAPSKLGIQATTRTRSDSKVPATQVQPAQRRYFAQITVDGPILPGQLKEPVGVLDLPNATIPIGTARVSGTSDDGQAAWELTVHGRVLPGRFVIRDREFKPLIRT